MAGLVLLGINFMNKNQSIEIEVRYRLTDIQEALNRIVNSGAVLQKKFHIVDHWFIPKNITNLNEHDKWYNIQRGVAIRIRENDVNSVLLETKQLVVSKDHTSFFENSIQVNSYENAKKILLALDKKEFLTIDKKRTIFKLDLFEIVIDEIRNFDSVLEIEIKNVDNKADALDLIRKYASTLGLTVEHEYRKSATVEVMKKLAKF